MIQRVLFPLILCTLVTPMIGCGGGSKEATYDAASGPPVTQEDIKKREDYEAKMKQEQKEMYGK